MFWKRKKKKFICSQCGEFHKEWPSLAYQAPLHYHVLTQEEKEARAFLNDDFCTIKNESDEYRFIRVVLEQKIKNHSGLFLEYGLWVSLSETSFEDYRKNFKQGKKTTYFGWLSNRIDGYEDTTNIPMDVYAANDGIRPVVVPQKGSDHQLVRNFYEGISKEEAERRIHLTLENNR